MGRPRSFAASRNTRLASKTASPVRGRIGENQTCPLLGVGFVSDRAPIQNVCKLGMPNCGRLNLACTSGVNGSLYASPSVNLAPGIAENLSFANSQFPALAWGPP